METKKYEPTWHRFIPAWMRGQKKVEIESHGNTDFGGGTTTLLFTLPFDGEKNLGEIGPIKQYIINYDLLRLRSWQSFIESEVTQTVVKRFTTWVVGRGLKLQSEPLEPVLESEGIKINTQEFTKFTEARFNCYRKSTSADWAGMRNLNRIAKSAFKNAIVGGDVLVVLRYIDNTLTVQLIDGSLIQSPIFGTDSYPRDLANGNKLLNGIEVDARGKHIRYYIRDSKTAKYTPIEARSEATGLTTAFMVYGLEYRLNNVRGLPLISAVIETLKKMERYKEAVIGSAEERQKIAYTIEHGINSTGENPLSGVLAKAYKVSDNDDIPEDVEGNKFANTMAASMNKQVFNMPQDSKLAMHNSTNELQFKDFYSVNIELICAALGIPPEVAMSKYDSNFSASRAALKDWEHTLNVCREEFADDFYQKIYNFWLYTEILNNKIQAPGFLRASLDKNEMIMGAYQNARFVGASVPHIDPLKEVKAIREMLGDQGASVPLITVEEATEFLGGGDSKENFKQYADELQDARDKEIIPKPEPVVVPVKGSKEAMQAQINSIEAMLKDLHESMQLA